MRSSPDLDAGTLWFHVPQPGLFIGIKLNNYSFLQNLRFPDNSTSLCFRTLWIIFRSQLKIAILLRSFLTAKHAKKKNAEIAKKKNEDLK